MLRIETESDREEPNLYKLIEEILIELQQLRDENRFLKEKLEHKNQY